MGILDSLKGGDILSAGSSVLGGLLGFQGASDMNSANAANFQQQMNFLQGMRSTQYQTAVADLKAAGLNPMLAYMHAGGGAGTPGAPSAPVYEAPMSKGVASALEAVRTHLQAREVSQRQVIKEPLEKVADVVSSVVDKLPDLAQRSGELAGQAVVAAERLAEKVISTAQAVAGVGVPSPGGLVPDAVMEVVRQSPTTLLGKAQKGVSAVVNSAVDVRDAVRKSFQRAEAIRRHPESASSMSSARAQAKASGRRLGTLGRQPRWAPQYGQGE